jgi:hypothetical protein
MKQIIIKKLDTTIGWGALLEDNAYQIWIDSCIANNSWGKPERWLSEQECQAQQENIVDSIDSRNRVIVEALGEILDGEGNIIQSARSEETIVEYKFPCQYIIEIADYVEPYTVLRQREYPSIGDQLDMLYWDKVNNTNNWKDLISSIKVKYPKE